MKHFTSETRLSKLKQVNRSLSEYSLSHSNSSLLLQLHIHFRQIHHH